MAYYLVKLVITAVLVVTISEVAKRSSLFGALLASIPLISVMAIIWLYIDTRDVARVSALASSVFWLVLPSLVLFIALPVLLKLGVSFYLSLSLSIGLTTISYWLMIRVAGLLGYSL